MAYEMDSALAYYLSPFSLYRPYEDLEFHTVTQLDRWAGSRAPKTVPVAVPRARTRWESVLKELTPLILLPRRRRKS